VVTGCSLISVIPRGIRQLLSMYIPFLPVSLQSSVSGSLSPDLNDPRIMFFEFGRQAMRVGLDALGIKKGDTVLMPTSLCSAVIEPFYDMGVKIRLYELGQNLKFSLDDILASVTATTKAIYVIHYFGIRSDMADLRRFCTQRNIALIEDCALSGYSVESSQLEFGDVCIYSLWKFHALPDGAILKIKKQLDPFKNSVYKPPAILKTLIRRLKIEIKKRTMRGAFPLKTLNIVRGKRKDIPLSNERGEKLSPMTAINGISQLSLHCFLREDLEGIAYQRRSNFNSLTAYCRSNNIRTLYRQLAEHDIPYCFPIVVDNPMFVKKKLAEAGIESEISVNVPPSLSNLIDNTKNYSHLEQLSLRCISIPIHQNIDAAMLDYLKSKLSSVIALADGDGDANQS